MELFENTLYINLKERTDRNDHVLKEFEKVGIMNPQRINANRTKDGAIGCSMSHIKCLEFAKKNDYEFVFICEDDITFTDVDLFKKQLDKFMNSEYICDWDVIIISGNNGPPYQPITDYLIRVHNVQAATGYVVRNHYYDKMINNFKEGLSMLIRNPRNKREYACDMYWKHLQQNDIWYMIVPSTVVQYPNYSDIENRVADYTHLMKDVSKEWLLNR